MKKLLIQITILLAFFSATNTYATDVKAAKVLDRAQLATQSHQSLVQKSESSLFDIDVLELIEEGTDETDDSEDENRSFSTPNFHNFYLAFARFPTFLSKKTPYNTRSFSRSLPIFIFIRVLRL